MPRERSVMAFYRSSLQLVNTRSMTDSTWPSLSVRSAVTEHPPTTFALFARKSMAAANAATDLPTECPISSKVGTSSSG
jgi:hypothetical protein